MKWATTNSSQAARTFPRRSFLGTAMGACAITPIIRLPLQLGTPGGGSLTKEQRDRMTPAQVIEELKKGNERFRAGKMASRDYLAENAPAQRVSIRRR
jgi:carbonic anhydrase